MAQIKHLFIVCGEASGDLHAANLARAIQSINSGIKFSGVGGDLLRRAGAQIYCDIQGLAVMGFFDVLKKLPKFFSLKKLILEKIEAERPDAICLVDFSGFNLRLARTIQKKIPVIYYVSPQVWASRRGRLETIRKYISRMLVLFKFEQDFYQRNGITAEFVGHPLLDIVRPELEKEEFLKQNGLAQEKATLALLPGSRRQEVKNILPVMLEAASIIQQKLKNVQFVIAKPPQLEWDIYNRWVSKYNLDLKVLEGRTYDCLGAADFCLVCSGTATLEAAIMEKPMAVIYRMNLANYILYRPQVKLPYISMVNIVGGRKIVPEFIQFQARPGNIAEAVLKIMRAPTECCRLKNELREIKASLGPPGASLRAAKAILSFLETPPTQPKT